MFDTLLRKRKMDARPSVAPTSHFVNDSRFDGKPSPAPATKTAPGTSIGYHPELVPEMKHDHQLLLRIYTDIGAAHKAGDLVRTCTLLEQFRNTLNAHLLKEKVRLYIYLEHALANNPRSHELVKHFRIEMEGIGREVVAFLNRYRSLAFDPELAATFAADLAAIGEVLGKRIRSEEHTLYPLYSA